MSPAYIFASAILLAGFQTIQATPDWPQFRGDDQSGRSSETGVPLTWSSTDNIAWKTPIPGESWSSPIVWKDRVFVTNATDGGKSHRYSLITRVRL